MPTWRLAEETLRRSAGCEGASISGPDQSSVVVGRRSDCALQWLVSPYLDAGSINLPSQENRAGSDVPHDNCRREGAARQKHCAIHRAADERSTRCECCTTSSLGVLALPGDRRLRFWGAGALHSTNNSQAPSKSDDLSKQRCENALRNSLGERRRMYDTYHQCRRLRLSCLDALTAMAWVPERASQRDNGDPEIGAAQTGDEGLQGPLALGS
ncbi:hypothetical protein CMUS01_14722 [Colletotrichum musicola]|uniref:Uncharacterized protein n=1 Tax=Colletotrichum musicola TaxID=2175873 RepID=A0A8H6J2K9_9PEZI|nr:hypothetical protein CMUS01_14722 [Colletotrichum musicola]